MKKVGRANKSTSLDRESKALIKTASHSQNMVAQGISEGKADGIGDKECIVLMFSLYEILAGLKG